MDVRKRIIAAYAAWGVAALGTTLSWATARGASFSGQTAGLNGGLAMVLCLVTAGLIAWWDRGSRFDVGRIRMALFVGIATVAVVLRNAYNIAVGDLFGPGLSIGYGLWISMVATIAGVVLTRTLMSRPR